MTEHSPASLPVTYPSREVFLDGYDRELRKGRATVLAEQALALQERVELRVSFPGLRGVLRLRGTVAGVEQGTDGSTRLKIALSVHSASWARLQLQVEQIRQSDPALIAPVLHVLVVEDNPHVARLIREGLEAYVRRHGQGHDFAISYAANGKDALEQLTNSRFDLLLADVYLPILDGEHLFRAIRADSRLGELPIVAFSAGGDDARKRALGSGADCFLEKPVRLAELLRALRHALEKRGPRREQ